MSGTETAAFGLQNVLFQRKLSFDCSIDVVGVLYCMKRCSNGLHVKSPISHRGSHLFQHVRRCFGFQWLEFFNNERVSWSGKILIARPLPAPRGWIERRSRSKERVHPTFGWITKMNEYLAVKLTHFHTCWVIQWPIIKHTSQFYWEKYIHFRTRQKFFLSVWCWEC